MLLSDEEKKQLKAMCPKLYTKKNLLLLSQDNPSALYIHYYIQRYKFKKYTKKRGPDGCDEWTYYETPEFYDHPLSEEEKKEFILSYESLEEKQICVDMINSIEKKEPFLLHFREKYYWDLVAFRVWRLINTEGKKNGFKIPKPVLLSYPTDLAHISPFYPMTTKEYNHPVYIEDKRVIDSSWGYATVSGPKLSTSDEDVLMTMLALAQDKSCEWAQISKINIDAFAPDYTEIVKKCNLQDNELVSIINSKNTTFTYIGPMLPILQQLGYNTPGKREYNRVLRSLRRMRSTVFEVQLSDGIDPKTGKKHIRYLMMPNIITTVGFVEVGDTKYLKVVMDPFFYHAYHENNITIYDLTKRLQIKSAYGKAMYRFVQSHDLGFSGKITTLCKALNIDVDRQPMKEIRRSLKNAIKELLALGLLDNDSFITNKNKKEKDFIQLKKVKYSGKITQ